MQKSKIKIVSNKLKSNQNEYGKMKMKSSRRKRWTSTKHCKIKTKYLLLFIIFGILVDKQIT